MESTPKTPWSRKRKLQAKMERIRQAEPSGGTSSASLSPEGTGIDEEREEMVVTLDESLRVPVSTQLMSDHSSSGESSDSDSDNSDFTVDDARRKYLEWLKQQPKESIKVIAVMFMDTPKRRFDMTTVGAAKEVGLLLHHNEKTIHSWHHDYYRNQGHFTGSRKGKHSRQFVLDDEDFRQKATRWVRANATVKGKPNLTGAKFVHG